MKLYKLEFQTTEVHVGYGPKEEIFYIEGKGIIQDGRYTPFPQDTEMGWMQANIIMFLENPEKHKKYHRGSNHFSSLLGQKEITEEQLQKFIDAQQAVEKSLEDLVRMES